MCSSNVLLNNLFCFKHFSGTYCFLTSFLLNHFICEPLCLLICLCYPIFSDNDSYLEEFGSLAVVANVAASKTIGTTSLRPRSGSFGGISITDRVAADSSPIEAAINRKVRDYL